MSIMPIRIMAKLMMKTHKKGIGNMAEASGASARAIGSQAVHTHLVGLKWSSQIRLPHWLQT
jgi:hypothetical protein